MSVNNKRPPSITLAAAIIICIITFISGFIISSVAFLDSRLEAANEKNAALSQTISEKDDEIKALKDEIDQKNENNIILGEQIQEHLTTIASLSGEVSHLQSDVDLISEAALNGTFSETGTNLVLSLSALSVSQQLIILVVLFVIIIFIISVTCGIIASKSSGKKRERKPGKAEVKSTEEEELLPQSEASVENEEHSSNESVNEIADEEKVDEIAPEQNEIIPAVSEAIDLLYHNNLEDSIADLGGFKFGITNFDEILSDKRRPKSFGNSENGDFVAFISSHGVKKLYIIPRTMVLSDSTVALRGVIDLFSVTNEGGEAITHGTVKIKEITSPAVFACGEAGWAIESKGEIIALGGKSI